MKRISALTVSMTLAVSGLFSFPAAAHASEKEYKIAMILDSSINDGGWGSACYNAMVTAAENRGWEYQVSDNIAQNEFYESIVSYCNLGYDMIYAPGNEYTDAVVQAAEEYPAIAFALLNGSEDVPGEAMNGNITSLLPDAQQIGWTAGALAGLMSKTGTIAFIGGMELDTTLRKYDGYVEAAAYTAEQEGREVKALDAVFAGSFDAVDKGIEFANVMMDQGADVFFGDASAVDSGARQAIDAVNDAAGGVTVYDIGQPADILGQNECVICSQITDNSSMIELSMEALENGSFGGEVIYGTLQNGALSAGAISDLVPEEIQEKYLEYLEQMKNETFMK